MTPLQIAAKAVELRDRIRPYIRTTPLEALASPSGRSPAYAKCEHFQVTGSFKVRGAVSAILELSEDQRQAGVTTASTGNHGAAIAYGAHHLGIEATVFVPTSTPVGKIANIRRWGARIEEVPGDPIGGERLARADAETTGRTYISPYNDAVVVAGQGTIGVELCEQLEGVDTLIVSVGGGGLISGVASVVRTQSPNVRVIGCAASNSKVMLESIRADKMVDKPSLPTLSDGTAGAVERDTVTFDLCRTLVDDWIELSEEEIASALLAYVNRHHQLIEGSAALALAGYKRFVDSGADLGTCVVITCGSNIDLATFTALAAASDPPSATDDDEKRATRLSSRKGRAPGGPRWSRI